MKKNNGPTNAQEQEALGDKYYNGIGVEQDIQKAVYWYLKSANQGNTSALMKVKLCKFFDLKDESGNSDALTKQKKSPKETEESIEISLFKKSAAQGDAIDQFNLGVCYEDGIEVAQNLKKAVIWYTKSAKQGYVYAQFNLALCYAYGKGVAKDLKEAVFWFTKAAEQGEVKAEHNLWMCYADGKGVEIDFKKALFWCTRAAEHGNFESQFMLALSYEEGQWGEKNLTKAIFWYETAANQGLANAQFNLALCYAAGKGGEIDLKKAVFWFTKAAEQGLVDAQFNLGVYYEYGYGVKKDLDMSLSWYEKAAKNGDKEALKRCGELTRKIQKSRTKQALTKKTQKTSRSKNNSANLPPAAPFRLTLNHEELEKAKQEQKYTEERLRIDYGTEIQQPHSSAAAKPAQLIPDENLMSNPMSDSNMWQNFVARLDANQTAYLKALLENKSERELKTIAAKSGKMHDLFVDRINAIGIEILGEPLIEEGHIFEEYAKALCGVLFQ